MRTTSPAYSRLLFENNWWEVRYACRSLARNPGFTATTILILALGIGMTASVFSVAEPLLSRALPVRDPGSLLLFRTANPALRGYEDHVPDELFYRLAGGSTTLAGVFGFVPLSEHVLETDTASDRVQVHLVTGAYFSVLGVNAVVGRIFAESDDDAGARDVAVISHRLWQRHFNGDPDAVGKTIRFTQPNGGIDRSGVIVVGVAPAGFHGVDLDSDPDVWVPFRVLSVGARFSDGVQLGGVEGVGVMGRVQEGVPVAAVKTEVDVLASQLTDLDLGLLRGEAGRFNVLAEPGGRGYSRLRYEFLEPVVALSAAVGVVLLIVWTNLAALMLGRGAFRCREMAIRLALGSDRRRLLGLFLREGLILALAGGSLGLILAFWGTEFLASWLPPESVLASRIEPSWRTLAFTAAVSMLGVVLFAFLPGLKGANMAIALPASGSAGRTGRRGAFAMGHRIAVVAQIALSLFLLIGAGLFLRTLQNLRSVDTGFDEHELLQFEIEQTLGSRRLREFAETGLARLGSLPGVRSTTYYWQGLLQEGGSLPLLQLSVSPGGPTISAQRVAVGPRFFETLRIPLVSGRTLREELVTSDTVLSEDAYYLNRGEIVLSTGLAARLFEGEDPIGRRVLIELNVRDDERPEVPVFERFDVVGVAGDVRHVSLRDQSDLTFYTFITVNPAVSFLVRAEGHAAALVPAVRQVVDEFDPESRITNAVTLALIREASIAPERFVAQIAALFALSSLILAAIGTYGVFAYSAALRRAELGIRMALGARRGTVIAMFMRDSVRTIGPGVVLGLLAALATTRLLESMLFGVTPMDPLSIITATVVLAATAAFAAYLPARRASRLDPMVILHDE